MKLGLFAAAASTLLVASPAYAQFSGPRIEGRLAYEAVEATINTGDPLDTGDEEAICLRQIGNPIQPLIGGLVGCGK